MINLINICLNFLSNFITDIQPIEKLSSLKNLANVYIDFTSNKIKNIQAI